ncbi:unnamed protein product, partial [marine sediment metagenome]
MGTFTITQSRIGNILYLNPSGIGCNTDLTPIGDVNNWQCVDDPQLKPDDDTTYVHSDATDLKYDLYTLPDTTETGIINHVKIYTRAKSDTYAQGDDGIYKIIVTDNACSNIYKSNDIDILTDNYRTYSNVLSVNPRTSNSWKWDDIDNLQIGNECNSPTLYFPDTATFRPDADVTTELNSIACESVVTNYKVTICKMHINKIIT